jgi:pilus assembly protein FimV
VARSITIVIAACVLSLAALSAQAAGLGRLTVLSPLGQPLLAEVEIVSLQPGEEEGLSARLASPEAFRDAGIDLSPALFGMRISIERRDKRAFLRLTTQQPVNEPFLDLLIELQWPSGRLVREYTFLLDPPEYKSRPAIAAAPPPPAPAPQAAAPVEKPAAIEEKPIPPAAPPAEAAAAPAPSPAPEPAAEAPKEPATQEPTKPEEPAKPAAATHEVKKGDTLGAIARANLPPGVSLNQMLIALFRANEDAFIRGNVNLVRTGKILNIPSADAIGTIDSDEANRLVKEHHGQFMEYRSRLAAVPAVAEAGAQREAAGRIEPKPGAAAPAAPADQLRLSKVEPSKPAAPGSRAAREDDAVARERALQESQSRSKDLEKNVADLQKLLELKNQQLAELEKRGAAKPAPTPAPTPAPVPPIAQAPEKPAAKAPEKPAAAPPPVPAPVPAPAPAPQAAKPEAAPPPPAEKKAEAPKPKPKAAPPPPEPSIIEEFADNPLYIAALGGVLILLLVYGMYAYKKKKKAQTKFQDSVLGAAAAGGGAAAFNEPTTASTAASAAASQSPVSKAPAGMEAEEVDPIAEADVYMAYGRDAQAEEILKEALQKDPSRIAVHAKLLEIYANRKDAKSFEQTALKLKNLTKGSGPEWEKAAALGRSIDPQNTSYGEPSGAAVAAAAAAPAAVAAPTLDFDLGGASQGAAPAPDISLDEPGKDPTATGVDFDLGATQTLKMDKKSADETVVAKGPGEDKSIGSMDFNLDLGAEEKPQPAAPAPAKPAEEPSGGLDFDLDLGTDKKADLSAISLDLGTPGGDETVLAPQGAATDPKWQEVATKLDLAKAYEEMGDKDGARELLNEVMKDGDTAQKGQAQQLLAKLG